MKYYILLVFCLFTVTLSAQSLADAQKMFTQGEYEKAKPVFQRYVKTQPANANYNFWYGACLVETGEAEESIPYLEQAHKRKVQNTPLFLGKAYDKVYRFDEAVKMLEEYIAAQQKRRQPVEALNVLLDKFKRNARMIKGVEEVTVIDTFIVDKVSFLDAYKLSEESGSLHFFSKFFKSNWNHEGTVYETELKNRIYYGNMDTDNTYSIYSRNKMIDEWSKESLLPGSVNDDANSNYPFLLTDGITIYYASDGENSMGGYDIFVTRYNTGTETYLNPENVGMPFNSPYNDYMYVIDEYNDLGWFASDRYQPEGKVCVYVFIPNESKQTYNYEQVEPVKMRNLAQLISVKDTWEDDDAVKAAKKRLEAAINRKPQEEVHYDFDFIVNDDITYHSLNDFKSPTAKKLFVGYQQLMKDYRQQIEKLAIQRKWYVEAGEDQRKRTTPAIIDLEKRVHEMSMEVDQFEIKIRNEEIQTIKK
jgi:WD40-like Beta Propeller Repeat.